MSADSALAAVYAYVQGKDDWPDAEDRADIRQLQAAFLQQPRKIISISEEAKRNSGFPCI